MAIPLTASAAKLAAVSQCVTRTSAECLTRTFYGLTLSGVCTLYFVSCIRFCRRTPDLLSLARGREQSLPGARQHDRRGVSVRSAIPGAEPFHRDDVPRFHRVPRPARPQEPVREPGSAASQ
jgi:hypothetical protein